MLAVWNEGITKQWQSQAALTSMAQLKQSLFPRKTGCLVHLHCCSIGNNTNSSSNRLTHQITPELLYIPLPFSYIRLIASDLPDPVTSY